MSIDYEAVLDDLWAYPADELFPVRDAWLEVRVFFDEIQSPQPQLTTGDDVFDVNPHDDEDCSICAPFVGPLFPVWPLPPCTCRYGLHPTLWNPTHLIDIPGVGQRGAAYTFRIDPWCPHHAPVHVGGWNAFPDRPYEVLLDEDERTGN